MRFGVNQPKQIEVRFYTKDGCHLCEEARQMLTAIADEVSLAITEVDITRDPKVYERFKYAIPVIEVDGAVLIGGRFSLADLREALAEVAERGTNDD
ncbi:MAG: glutaredoxin family protein [Chloroflexi bacterium]|nr:glutaredoxin family protein [Chloroflexota bacterium]